MTFTRSLLAIAALSLLCVLVSPPHAHASAGALKILIASSDGAHTEATLKGQIAAQPGVAAVDTFDAGAATPTVQTLQGYDLVVSFSNTDYANSAALGDNLATYADGGGIVTEFTFNWFNRAQDRLGGRWATGAYSAFEGPASAVIKNGATFGPHEASSPLLAGVSALGTETHQDVGLTPGAVEVAKWSDGQSAVAFKGRAVGVNACVADGCQEFSGDFAKLIVNAARMRVAGQLFLPNAVCATPDTFLQTGVADGNPYTLPQGVITSWYVQDGTPAAPDAKLTVARAAGTDAFTLVGESASGARAAAQVSGPFPARIPVAGGDVIGLTTPGGSGRCAKFTNNPADTLTILAAGPLTAEPTPVLATSKERFPIQAVVEPDADNDGFGDLTQDRCTDVPGSANGCRSADLSLTVTASAPSVPLGGAVTYTVAAKNKGPDPAPDVVVTNTPPGGTPTKSSLGTLASGQGSTVRFATKPAVGPATDTATVTSGADDPNATDNSATSTVAVIGPAVLSRLTQTHRKWRLPAGTTFRFVLDKPAPVLLRFAQHGKVRGTLRVRGRAGANKLRFHGRLTRTRKLRRGSYTLVASAGASRKTLRFTILR